MTMHGRAFLALWNDVDPARDAEYDCWHTFEHVPERVGIAGILSARRYVARERDDLRYFTLYDLESLAALDGPQYKDVAERPTAWSLSMRPSFRNFLRRPCESVLRLGRGIAAGIATFRFAIPEEVDATAWRAALQPHLEHAGVSAIHLGRADTDADFPVRNAAVDDEGAGAPHVLLVEAIDRAQLEPACPDIADLVQRTGRCERPPAWETYAFAFAIGRESLPGPTDRRQSPREDLRRTHPRYQGPMDDPP